MTRPDASDDRRSDASGDLLSTCEKLKPESDAQRECAKEAFVVLQAELVATRPLDAQRGRLFKRVNKAVLLALKPGQDPKDVLPVDPRYVYTTWTLGHRQSAPEPERAALEAAILRYETLARQRIWDPARSAQVAAVECSRPAPPFRGKPAFACLISLKDSSRDWNCFALVAGALYEVGGCFDPIRGGLDEGGGRLLRAQTGSGTGYTEKP